MVIDERKRTCFEVACNTMPTRFMSICRDKNECRGKKPWNKWLTPILLRRKEENKFNHEQTIDTKNADSQRTRYSNVDGIFDDASVKMELP